MSSARVLAVTGPDFVKAAASNLCFPSPAQGGSVRWSEDIKKITSLVAYLCLCVFVYLCACTVVYLCTCVLECLCRFFLVLYLCMCVLVYLFNCVFVHLCTCVIVFLRPNESHSDKAPGRGRVPTNQVINNNFTKPTNSKETGCSPNEAQRKLH